MDRIGTYAAIVGAFIVAGLIGALVYVSLAPSTYTAEADLLVTPVAADNPNLIGLPLVRETSDATSDVLTVSKLVSSPQVASLVSAKLGGSPGSLLGQISAAPVSQSQIIAVRASAGDPTRAAELANAFALQTVQARTDVVHQQLATLIPTLEASMAHLDPGERGALAAQLAELQTLRVLPDPTLRVSSSATPPSSPSSPKRTLSLGAGGFAGLIVGVLVVLGLNALDPKLRDEEQLREIYELPLLARVPRQRAGAAPLAPNELTAPVASAFRTLRAAFTVKRGEDEPGRTIFVTGDTPGDGKTTVAINLAATLAAAGKQVMLIESDLRRPSIGRALRVRASHGVIDVLSGKSELVDTLVWLRPYGPQLELLLAAGADSHELDRISAARARKLIDDARAICDFVVIDSPPLCDVADALPLAHAADDVLLVARTGVSHVGKMSDLGELLTRQGITPTGVALVGAAEGRSRYYYGYGAGAEQTALLGLLRRRAEHPEVDPQPELVHRNGAEVS
jgi:capsular exopolysaccharide synthesis family protein